MIAQDRQPQLNTRAGQPFRFLGVPTTLRATRETTGGAFGLLESSAMPPGFGSPCHVHHSEATGAVLHHESVAFAKAAPDDVMVLRLFAVEAGGERVLGEYEMRHTRTIPGPAAW